MPIEITCSQCQIKLRVPDSAAGRKAKCPKCSFILLVPQSSPVDSFDSSSEPPKPLSQSLGSPASDNPVAHSPFARRTPEKTTDYKSGVPYGGNPYGAPAAAPDPKRPELIDLNTVFSYAWQVFTQNLGLLLGVAITLGVVTLIDNALTNVIENTRDGAVVLFCYVGSRVLTLVQLFLGIGQARIALKLCRGQMAEYGDLFTGGDRFLKIVGWSLLIIIPCAIAAFLLMIPLLFLVAIFWPSYYLIVDRRTGVFESFSAASEIGMPNLWNSLLLILASVGIILLGFFACVIGLLFAGCYVSVMSATAYLMMTGEIQAGAVSRG